MPRISGLELVRQLRGKNSAGKIVVLSAHLGQDNVTAYELLGVDMMISKPFDVDELRAAIDVLTKKDPMNGNGSSSLKAKIQIPLQ